MIPDVRILSGIGFFVGTVGGLYVCLSSGRGDNTSVRLFSHKKITFLSSMDLKDKLKSAFFNMMGIMLTISQNMLILPMLINTWGLQMVGIWQISMGVTTILLSLDQGFQMYITNIIGKELIQKSQTAPKLFATGLLIVIFGNISLMLMVCLLAFFPLVPDYLNIDHSFYYDNFIPFAFFFQYLSVVINTCVSGMLSKIYVNQGYASKSIAVSIWSKFIMIISLLLACLFERSFLESQIVSLLLIIGINLHTYYRFKTYFPDFFPWWKNHDFSLLNHQYKVIFGVLLFYIVDPFVMHGTSLIISNAISVEHVAIFNLTRTIPNAIITGSVIMIGSLTGEIMKFHYQHHLDKLAMLFHGYWFFGGAFTNFVLAGLLYFIHPLFDYLIQGKGSFDYWLSAFFTISVSIGGLIRLILVYFSSINETKKILSNSILRTTISLALSFIFLRMNLFWGLGLAVLIAEFVSGIVLSRSLIKFWAKENFHIRPSFFTQHIIPVFLLLGIYFVCFLVKEPWQKAMWNTVGIFLLGIYYYVVFQTLSPEIRAFIGQKTADLRKRVGL
jgi:O-antigen/teichoic acid export membrane protein